MAPRPGKEASQSLAVWCSAVRCGRFGVVRDTADPIRARITAGWDNFEEEKKLMSPVKVDPLDAKLVPVVIQSGLVV
jgi:hypothetical protein